jgi:signal peptidase II
LPRPILLLIAFSLIVLDQGSKWLVKTRIPLNSSIPLGHWFRLTYCHNTGGAFSLLAGQTAFFLAVGVIVTGLLIWSLPKISRLPGPTALAYALLLGGAIGNLIDRFRYGYVVDFIDFGKDANWWPVFNVADSGITVGIILLGWAVFSGQESFPGDSKTLVPSASPNAAEAG